MSTQSHPPFQVDLEQRLRLYMPAMFRLLSDRNLKAIQWRRLNKKFVEEHKKRKLLYEANNNYLRIEANFYDLINATINGDQSAFRLVGYFDILFKGLDNNLLPLEKVMVRDTVYFALINFDHKFRNFIGELSVLLNAVENRRYSLLGIEKDIIANNNTADFTLLDNATGAKELAEVVNIHLDDSNYLKENLVNKIEKKLEEKTNKLVHFAPFSLIPIIWAPWEVLKDIATLYKSGDVITINGVVEPVAYCAFCDSNNRPIYRFGPISTLFPKGDIFVKWVD